MHFKSIDDMNHAVMRNLSKIPRDVDLIVGIPRSGLLVANMLSLYLNLPMTDVEGLGERRLISKGKRVIRNFDSGIFDHARRVLVVDDCVSRGTELEKAKRKIIEYGYADRALYATVYSFTERADLADIVFEIIPRPMCFQWCCMHSPELANYCLDIDGLLCVDPTAEEDDDGARYEEFLRNAQPLFLPTVEVGWLVTCRLEKYRDLTVQWLQKHGVEYRHLIMMDYPTRAARERAKEHVAYKARVYKESGASLFIESSPVLASRIARASGLPVMCMDTSTVTRAPMRARFDIFKQRTGLDRWIRAIRRVSRRVASRISSQRQASA